MGSQSSGISYQVMQTPHRQRRTKRLRRWAIYGALFSGLSLASDVLFEWRHPVPLYPWSADGALAHNFSYVGGFTLGGAALFAVAALIVNAFDRR